MQNKFSVKLVVQIVAVIIIISLSLTLLSYNRAFNMIYNEVDASMQNEVKSASDYFVRSLEQKKSENELMARTELIQSMDWKRQEAYIKSESNTLNAIRIQISDDKGMTKIPGGKPFSIADKPNFKATISTKKTVVTPPLNSSADNKRIVIITSPIIKGNAVEGILGSVYDASFFNTIVNKYSKDGKNFAFIVSDNGTVLAHHDQTFIETTTNLGELYANDAKSADFLKLLEKMKNGNTGFDSCFYLNEDKYISYTPIENTSWSIALVASKNEKLAPANHLRNMMFILMAFFILIGIVIALLIAKFIKKPLENVNQFSDHLSKGDLSFRMESKRTDEFGQIMVSLNKMADKIASLLSNVSHSTETVVSASDTMHSITDDAARVSDEVSKSMEEMARTVSQQTGEIMKGSHAVDELATRIDYIYDNIRDVNEKSKLASQQSEEGKYAVDELVDKTNLTNQQVNKVSKIVIEVDESVQSIHTITDTIGMIAEQTNLLALNAAIESARAGEAGKGFAVVADEIRKLAEQSSRATGEIQDIIFRIKGQSEVAVSTMEQTGDMFSDQTKSVHLVGEKFKVLSEHLAQTIELVEKTEELNTVLNSEKSALVDMLSSISAMSEQSAAAIQEVAAASEEQASGMNEISKKSDELHHLSDALQREVQQFKSK